MNEQEKLWKGEFGNAYHDRNHTQYRLDFWIRVLKQIPFEIKSVLELGAGKGDNLAALHLLIPAGRFTGVEINAKAAESMRSRNISVIQGAIKDVKLTIPMHDLVLTRGLLIHIPEEDLPEIFSVMYMAAKRYICIAEYFSTQRREVNYRGYAGALWTDDYAGRLMDQYPGLKLRDYGFHYSRDGGQDLTWFLMEKVK